MQDDRDGALQALDDALAALDNNQSALARVCGCTQGNIWQLLKNRRPLPPQYVLRVEEATGVSRHRLRPDIYPATDAQAA